METVYFLLIKTDLLQAYYDLRILMLIDVKQFLYSALCTGLNFYYFMTCRVHRNQLCLRNVYFILQHLGPGF
jgi:hypothetical protein